MTPVAWRVTIYHKHLQRQRCGRINLERGVIEDFGRDGLKLQGLKSV